MSEKLQNRKGGVFPVFKSNCDTLSASPEKAMAPHSSTLAWKIPWTEEPGRLQSMGSLRVGQDFHFSLSCFGEGNGNPLRCSCLENPRDRGAWWAAVYGVVQSRTRLTGLSNSNSSKCFPCSSVGKESACNAGDPDSIPGSGRSPGEGNGNPLPYSCLENSMDRGTWQATYSPRGGKSLTRFSD